MIGERHKNVCLIQIDASSFTEFEISELEISRFLPKIIQIWLVDNEKKIYKDVSSGSHGNHDYS